MNSRERVIAAIEFKGPDRIPHRHACLPAVFDVYPQVEMLLKRFPSDFAGEDGKKPALGKEHRKGVWTDEWGCVWTVLRDGYIGQATGHPLANWRDFADYDVPDADSGDLKAQEELGERKAGRYLVLDVGTVFERMVAIRGFENVMMDLMSGAPELARLRDLIVNYDLALMKRLLAFEPDGLYFSDDWGSQTGLFIKPSLWRDFFLPAYRKLFQRTHEAGKHVFFHTDGVTIEILPALASAGADVFWIDLSLNGISRLRDELGGKICFLGLTDVQMLLRSGTAKQVTSYAKELIAAFAGFNGGFIACSELAPDQPWENMVAILETFHQYSGYPLRLRG